MEWFTPTDPNYKSPKSLNNLFLQIWPENKLTVRTKKKKFVLKKKELN